jgi:hypothetical protein
MKRLTKATTRVELANSVVRCVQQVKWLSSSQHMAAAVAKGLTGCCCRLLRSLQRWNHHLRPDIKKDAWTEEEEAQLVEAHKELGNKWSDIARLLPGA